MTAPPCPPSYMPLACGLPEAGCGQSNIRHHSQGHRREGPGDPAKTRYQREIWGKQKRRKDLGGKVR